MASCFIHLGKQQKKKKNCADWYITDTTNTHRSLPHSYTFTKIFTSRTNPICLIFFVVFVITFFRQVQIFKFF